jgi:hypothetical protein
MKKVSWDERDHVQVTVSSWELDAFRAAVKSIIQLAEMDPLNQWSGKRAQLSLAIYRGIHAELSPICDEANERVKEAMRRMREARASRPEGPSAKAFAEGSDLASGERGCGL